LQRKQSVGDAIDVDAFTTPCVQLAFRLRSWYDNHKAITALGDQRKESDMEFVFYPKGVCSRTMELQVEDGVIKAFRVDGGCSGNLQGISRLVKGMRVEEVVSKLKGLDCGGKGTSCPDQLARALEAATKEAAKFVG